MREHDPDAVIAARLEITLRQMPKVRREIFLAIRLDGMTCLEIAARTGLSLRQVERQFAKGLWQLGEAHRGRTRAAQWRRVWRWIVGS